MTHYFTRGEVTLRQLMELPDGECFSTRPYLSIPPYHNLDFIRRSSTWRLHPHAHPRWQIFVVLSGSVFIEIRDVVTHLYPGEVSILPPNILHRMWAEEDYTQIGASVQPHSGDAHGISAYLDENVTEHTVVEISPHMNLCMELAQMFSENGAFVQPLLCAKMDVLLLHIFSILSEDMGNSFIRQMNNYLTQNLNKKVTLAKAAEHFHFSVSNLERLCKKHYGCGLLAHMNHVRLERACLLLTTTSLPVSEIAAQLAFRDPANFSQFFKKHLGVSPQRYRAEC